MNVSVLFTLLFLNCPNIIKHLPSPQAQLKPRDSSVEVRSDWEVKEEMDFPRLMKMRYMDVADPIDV